MTSAGPHIYNYNYKGTGGGVTVSGASVVAAVPYSPLTPLCAFIRPADDRRRGKSLAKLSQMFVQLFLQQVRLTQQPCRGVRVSTERRLHSPAYCLTLLISVVGGRCHPTGPRGRAAHRDGEDRERRVPTCEKYALRAIHAGSAACGLSVIVVLTRSSRHVTSRRCVCLQSNHPGGSMTSRTCS